MKPLIKRTKDMSREQVLAAQRENLARLMIYNREEIDDLAIFAQDINTSKARFRSPQYGRSTLVMDGVRGNQVPRYVIYGGYDAPAYPELDARRDVFEDIRSDMKFELIPSAGHWLQYEAADLFNSACIEWTTRNA
ncbi:MAG TPA: alpha/beta hydrolase [Dehalococcoidia bacterium]|nr:alpha/beta hydrolase [Dehalococcoidia bacterium]